MTSLSLLSTNPYSGRGRNGAKAAKSALRRTGVTTGSSQTAGISVTAESEYRLSCGFVAGLANMTWNQSDDSEVMR